MQEKLKEYIAHLELNKDFKSIQKISYDEHFQEYIIEVDRSLYESNSDRFTLLGIGFMSMYYQVKEGIQLQQSNVTMHLKDMRTKEIFRTIVYPDDLEK